MPDSPHPHPHPHPQSIFPDCEGVMLMPVNPPLSNHRLNKNHQLGKLYGMDGKPTEDWNRKMKIRKIKYTQK